ncbi:uncharacterized protein UDID_17047 [Ustilago sp. UG-2017a]|nr:uncharacterized protein UDID_17047 [Ustilago sp. UG-2017a]
MSNPDYSNYNDFVETMQDRLPRLPKILQNRFNREIASETYGTPTAPKDGPLLKYTMEEGDEEQTISPLSIMIKLNLFLANKEWDATCILDLKIEGPIKHVRNTEPCLPVKVETPMLVRGDTPAFDTSDSDRRLIGHEATPGPTPKLSAITNHHLKVLSGLNDKMKWEEQDLLDPRSVSVHVWQHKMLAMLSVVTFARNVLNQKTTTFEDADSMLSSIIMCSFSNKLHTKYFAEHATYDLRWDQVGSNAYDFLTKWEAHVSELHAYLKVPWMLDHRYRMLKRALPSDRNTLFNSVFILHERLHGKEQTAESVSNILRKCYELAAESAPVHLSPMSEALELIALRAATLINCWACGKLGHAANRCPDNAAYTRWKQGKIKMSPKGRANACVVLPLEDTWED